MNRRKFLKRLGVGAGAMVVAPVAIRSVTEIATSTEGAELVRSGKDFLYIMKEYRNTGTLVYNPKSLSFMMTHEPEKLKEMIEKYSL